MRKSLMDLGTAAPAEYCGRDGMAEGILAERLRPQELERQKLVDEQIAAGWGSTDADKIPADWRTNPGPDTLARRERFRHAGMNKPTFWGRRPRIARGRGF